MTFIRQLWAIILKDLLSELRSKEMVISMCLFSFLILIIFNFTFDLGTDSIVGSAPGVLWVAFIFSGLMGQGRAFGAERDRGTMPGLLLCPVSAWGIYLAKLVSTFIFMAVMEFFTLFLFAVLYNVSLVPHFAPLVLILFLGTLGFASIGTIFSAMSATTKARDVMLSILVFPVSVPMILASVKATAMILEGRALNEAFSWLKILIAFDMLYLLLAYLTFDFILEE
ncbi:MAG: heme exporter protein CcmB [Deltaproteobacteria bacterium]|nr:heme exporter protein CcmB [Deltaproteobacteria bacterium]